MIEQTLRHALAGMAPWISREHACWWRMHPGAAGDDPQHPDLDVVAQALAGALTADRGESGARRAVAGLRRSEPALARAVQRHLAPSARSLCDLAGRTDGPVSALAVYLVSLMVVDGSRPGGRVWLDDLAEILFMPPLLIRQLGRHWGCAAGAAA